jgi:hypothetical protein
MSTSTQGEILELPKNFPQVNQIVQTNVIYPKRIHPNTSTDVKKQARDGERLILTHQW